MPSKKPFGFLFFLVSFIFPFLDLFLFYQIIKLLVQVDCPILLRFRLVQNISTYAITLFVLMFKTVPSPILGYPLLTCQPTSLPNLLSHLFSYAIAKYLDFPFLLNNFIFLSFLFFLPLRPDGVCWRPFTSRAVASHI
jgi:hypothetical protein